MEATAILTIIALGLLLLEVWSLKKRIETFAKEINFLSERHDSNARHFSDRFDSFAKDIYNLQLATKPKKKKK